MNFKDELDELIKNYYRWLKDKTIIKEIGDGSAEITTPYLNKHNDYLQIYAKKEKDEYILTDDSSTITDLIMSGCDINSARRKEILKLSLSGFGVTLREDNNLFVKANPNNFSLKKHNLIQAMLAVSDMFYLTPGGTENIFVDEVIKWLDKSNIRYVSNSKFAGKTGYDNRFDFVIPKSNKYGERFIQTLSNPNKIYSQSIVFKWLDTKDFRPEGSQLYVLLNNSNKDVPSMVIEAFNNYELKPVLWTKKDEITEMLAA